MRTRTKHQQQSRKYFWDVLRGLGDGRLPGVRYGVGFLPFIAGVGLSVLIHGTPSIRYGALPWIFSICADTFLASMLLASLLDDLVERIIPRNKIAREMLGILASVGVITQGYTYFFVDYLTALTAAFISARGPLGVYPDDQALRAQEQAPGTVARSQGPQGTTRWSPAGFVHVGS